MLKLILLLCVKSNYIVKVMKHLYSIPKADNHWFATYHTYHKEKLIIIKSNYYYYFLY